MIMDLNLVKFHLNMKMNWLPKHGVIWCKMVFMGSGKTYSPHGPFPFVFKNVIHVNKQLW